MRFLGRGSGCLFTEVFRISFTAFPFEKAGVEVAVAELQVRLDGADISATILFSGSASCVSSLRTIAAGASKKLEIPAGESVERAPLSLGI